MMAEYMQNNQRDFINVALSKQVLKFGEFTLKSGRLSPYFFNAGLFDDGESMAIVAACYAQAIVDSGIQFDVLFGPAYKGIPLSAATAAALYNEHKINVPYAYNRKEKKDHGEGGTMVGASLEGKKVLIIDDVMTAGTAVREAIDLIEQDKGTTAGCIIALDRQEKGQDERSAVQQVHEEYGFPVASIITLAGLIDYLSTDDHYKADLDKMKAYREAYGSSN